MDIVLADDHALVRDGLAPFLERVGPGTRVIEAASAAEAMEKARAAAELGLVVLDLNMPGMDGLKGLAAMRAEFPAVPVVILSGSTNPADARRSMEQGAAGYVPKTMRGDSIVGVLRLILSGEKYVPPLLLEEEAHGLHAATPSHGHPRADSPVSILTPREVDILDMIVDGAPNKVIARALDLQEVTVKAHLRNMFRKLGVSNRTEAARVAIVAGMTGRNGTAVAS